MTRSPTRRGYRECVVAHRIKRCSTTQACLTFLAAIVVGSLGTGLGLAAAKLQDGAEAPHRPAHRIVRPLEESPPVLNRDRTLLDR